MRKLGAVLVALSAVLMFGGIAAGSHIVGCPHRPSSWTGTGANECASDGAPASNDAWSMGGGNDTAYGEVGLDIINGNGGADVLQGGADGDFLAGGDAGDNLYENEPGLPGSASDQVYGDDGNDNIECGRGTDTCRGGTGYDILWHCHDGGADDIGGFEEHIDVTDPGC